MIKKILYRTITLLLLITLFCLMSFSINAHSGRTDSSGGHHDNKNASGLGYYHYHCGGYPAHLHPNGYCPYTTPRSTISVKNMPSKMNVGDTETLLYSLGVSDDFVYWSSSDSDILEVSDSGVLTAVSPGTATVTAEMRTTSKSFNIKVLAVPVSSIKINVDKKKMTVGDTMQLKASVSPDNATYQNLTYKSSDKKIVKIDDSGTIKAVGIGSAKITVLQKESGVKSEITVKVSEILPKSICVEAEKRSVEITDKTKIKVTVEPSDATDKSFSLKSSDENIVVVSKDGTVTPKGLGNAIITATAHNGIKAETEITVFQIKEEAVNISVSTAPELVLFGKKFYDVNQTITLSADIFPSDATYKTVNFTSDDVEIDSSNNSFTPKGKGQITVNAITKNGVTSSINLEIYDTSVIKLACKCTVIILVLIFSFCFSIIYFKKRSKNKQ